MGVTPNEAKIELAWRTFKLDPVWAGEKCWKIEHPMGKRKWEMREPQREALKLWATGEDSITLKARQIGWSTAVGWFAAWMCMSNPDTKVLFLSKGERESRQLLNKVKFGLKEMPDWATFKAPKVVRSNMETVEWANGSSVISLPSRNNPARGFTGRLVVVDEWAFLENGAEAWASIEPVADIGGQVIGLSTANGAGNTFHDLWLRAKAGSSSFTPMFWGWRAVPERNDDWYEAKKMDMPTWQLHQEYPSTPEEAFIKSGHMVFDAEVLDYVKDTYIKPYWNRGALLYRGGENVFSSDEQYGPCRIWEIPDPIASYCIGADVAEGLEHGDYSSAHILRVARHGDEIQWRVVGTWHGHIEPDLFGDILYDLGRWFNECLVGVEANNHGLAVNNRLRDRQYLRLYREKRVDHRKKVKTERLGWWTDRKSKPVMVDDLRKALRQDLVMPDVATLDELYTYVNDGKGGTHGSPHDDRVMSLGLAVQMAPMVFHRDYVIERDNYLTLEWWLAQGEEQKTDTEGEPIVLGSQRLV